jgi:nucleoside-diphosphate-sugar epimerase
LWRTGPGFRGGEGDIVEFARMNILGTLELIEASFAARLQRFVFVSTCAVHEKILDDRALDETHPLWPLSHYGAHKAALEKFVHSYGFGHGFPICALRPTGIYGIDIPIEKSKWHSLISQVAKGIDVHVSGGGKEVHARDVAKAIELLLTTSADVSGQAYACYDHYISQHQVAMITQQLTGSTSQILGSRPEPRHEIITDKIRNLGMEFGGPPLLRETINRMVGRLIVKS